RFTFSEAISSGVHTVRCRQSSDWADSISPKATLNRERCCGATGPRRVASISPSGAHEIGGANRRVPTGGNAYRTPLKRDTPLRRVPSRTALEWASVRLTRSLMPTAPVPCKHRASALQPYPCLAGAAASGGVSGTSLLAWLWTPFRLVSHD